MIFPKAGMGEIPKQKSASKEAPWRRREVSSRAETLEKMTSFINKYANDNRKEAERALSNSQEKNLAQVLDCQERLTAATTQLASANMTISRLEGEYQVAKGALQKAEQTAAEAQALQWASEKEKAALEGTHIRARHQLSLRVATLKEELVKTQRELRAHRLAMPKPGCQQQGRLVAKENVGCDLDMLAAEELPVAAKQTNPQGDSRAVRARLDDKLACGHRHPLSARECRGSPSPPARGASNRNTSGTSTHDNNDIPEDRPNSGRRSASLSPGRPCPSLPLECANRKAVRNARPKASEGQPRALRDGSSGNPPRPTAATSTGVQTGDEVSRPSCDIFKDCHHGPRVLFSVS
eukprot:jgi/Botrbrau1/21254/Bobra.39_2s0047.2